MVWHRTDLLPLRGGPRPSTTALLPHAQLDQLPEMTVADTLLEKLAALEAVCFRQSRMAPPGVVALSLPDAQANGPKDAFIDDHEFCHFHHSEGGYFHMALPPQSASHAIKRGWGEIHLLAKAGSVARTIHLIYAPRTSEEVEVVFTLVLTSMEYAKGCRQ